MTETEAARLGREQVAPFYDAVVLGAGFAGLHMLHNLRKLKMTARAFEAGSDVGGTWYWNRYPGARCDAESLFYSFSFSEEIEQTWAWSERYATQPEILRYINHVADHLDLRRDITFDTRVTAARYDEAAACWHVETDRGERVSARFLITAVGCLSAGNTPQIPDLEIFSGRCLFASRWPQEPVDFSGERVGVIGTGSSGIQLIPVVAEQAAHLTVFQRTPNFSVPALNAPLDPIRVAEIKADYPALREHARTGRVLTAGDSLHRPEEWGPAAERAADFPPEERDACYERRWANGGAYFVATFGDLMLDEAANATAAEFVRRKIRSIVNDPAVAATLCPTDHPIGSKRICVDTNYYATYNRPNVHLHDLRLDPIKAIVPEGIRLRSDRHLEFDSLIFATGFDAITGPLLKIDIVGRDGVSLAEKWADGPRTYLGLGVHGFPNMFMITGPQSPSVLSNVVVSIEQHIAWISECLSEMHARNLTTIEAEAWAETSWREQVREAAEATLFARSNSWYNGANIPGKPRSFLAYAGGVGAYRDICSRVSRENYEGFSFRE